MKRIVGGLIILLLVLCSCGKGTLTWQEQYDLGVNTCRMGITKKLSSRLQPQSRSIPNVRRRMRDFRIFIVR